MAKAKTPKGQQQPDPEIIRETVKNIRKDREDLLQEAAKSRSKSSAKMESDHRAAMAAAEGVVAESEAEFLREQERERARIEDVIVKSEREDAQKLNEAQRQQLESGYEAEIDRLQRRIIRQDESVAKDRKDSKATLDKLHLARAEALDLARERSLLRQKLHELQRSASLGPEGGLTPPVQPSGPETPPPPTEPAKATKTKATTRKAKTPPVPSMIEEEDFFAGMPEPTSRTEIPLTKEGMPTRVEIPEIGAGEVPPPPTPPSPPRTPGGSPREFSTDTVIVHAQTAQIYTGSLKGGGGEGTPPPRGGSVPPAPETPPPRGGSVPPAPETPPKKRATRKAAPVVPPVPTMAEYTPVPVERSLVPYSPPTPLPTPEPVPVTALVKRTGMLPEEVKIPGSVELKRSSERLAESASGFAGTADSLKFIFGKKVFEDIADRLKGNRETMGALEGDLIDLAVRMKNSSDVLKKNSSQIQELAKSNKGVATLLKRSQDPKFLDLQTRFMEGREVTIPELEKLLTIWQELQGDFEKTGIALQANLPDMIESAQQIIADNRLDLNMRRGALDNITEQLSQNLKSQESLLRGQEAEIREQKAAFRESLLGQQESLMETLREQGATRAEIATALEEQQLTTQDISEQTNFQFSNVIEELKRSREALVPQQQSLEMLQKIAESNLNFSEDQVRSTNALLTHIKEDVTPIRVQTTLDKMEKQFDGLMLTQERVHDALSSLDKEKEKEKERVAPEAKKSLMQLGLHAAGLGGLSDVLDFFKGDDWLYGKMGKGLGKAKGGLGKAGRLGGKALGGVGRLAKGGARMLGGLTRILPAAAPVATTVGAPLLSAGSNILSRSVGAVKGLLPAAPTLLPALATAGAGGGSGGLITAGAPKAGGGIFSKLSGMVKGIGTTAAKGIGGAAGGIGGAAKSAGGLLSKVGGKALGPLAGLVSFGTSLASGESVAKAGTKAGGAVAGGALGAALGTALLPGVGTAIGGALGSMAGEWVSDKAFDFFDKGGVSKIQDKLKTGWDYLFGKKGVVTRAGNFFSGLWKSYSKFVGDKVWGTLKEGFDFLFGPKSLLQTLLGFVDKIANMTGLGGVFKSIKEWVFGPETPAQTVPVTTRNVKVETEERGSPTVKPEVMNTVAADRAVAEAKRSREATEATRVNVGKPTVIPLPNNSKPVSNRPTMIDDTGLQLLNAGAFD